MVLIELAKLTESIGLHAAAARLGVNPRTVRRWLHDESRPRADLAALVRLEARLALGSLDALGRGWPGWRLCPDGLLYAPDLADGFSPADLRGLPHLRQCVRMLRADLAQAHAQVAALQEQPIGAPVPGFVSLSGAR